MTSYRALMEAASVGAVGPEGRAGLPVDYERMADETLSATVHTRSSTSAV